MKTQKQYTKAEILAIAKNNGGFFAVDRNSYRADKLRSKLKSMAKSESCPLKKYSMTQKVIIYSL